MRRAWAAVSVAAVVFVLAPVSAGAQVPERRWQLDILGGLSLFDLPSSGEVALPPPGPLLPTSGLTNPSRRVPTWFLGDGASLLNGTNAEFGIAERLAPLDPALNRLGLAGSNAPSFGLRVRRQMSPRWSVEFGTELHAGAVEVDPDLLAAVEQARAGFEAGFTGLFTSGPFIDVSVSAEAAISGRSSRELVFSATVRRTFGSDSPGAVTPYLTFGAGVLHRLGDLPRVVLTGDYAFTASTGQGQASFAESDTLTIRYEQGVNLVGIIGGGLSRRLTERTGLSLDGRVYLGRQTLTMRLDSAPVVETRTPGAFIESFTTPAVQFSNNSTTGRDSTLSGTPLNGFKAFTTNGLQIRYVVTAAWQIRF
jgi:hypothetical protein